jgi:hypothetical protein
MNLCFFSCKQANAMPRKILFVHGVRKTFIITQKWRFNAIMQGLEKANYRFLGAEA